MQNSPLGGAKVLCYELNEVPWRVVDFYVNQRPKSSLAAFIKSGAAQITTSTVDSGELHPWSTWPTMHRGVSNDAHNIRFINQDLRDAERFPPIWQILADSGKTIGICGCLQSYPPMRRPEVLFHIPDTFARGPETEPSRYSAFQAINLKLTGENKAVTQSLSISDLAQGASLLTTGLTLRSAAHLARHLVQEKIRPVYKTRRATMQAHAAFDVFAHALHRSRPDFAAFFSNHVAGVMHRYWKHAFPSDFNFKPITKADKFHANSILMAMDIFDHQLGRLAQFAKTNKYELIVASSMGQQAIERGTYVPELLMPEIAPLAHALGFTDPIRMNLAMQPDIALEFESESSVQKFISMLPRLRDLSGNPVLTPRYEPLGRTLNLSLQRAEVTAREQALQLDEARIPLKELGLSLIVRDPGTGYHQPNGILLWSGPNQPPCNHREVMDSRRFAPSVLNALGVTPPPYMQPSATPAI